MIEQYNPQFSGKYQNDAGELLLTVLNMIHEETNRVDTPKTMSVNYTFEKSDRMLFQEYMKRD